MLKNDELTRLEISNDLAALIRAEAALRGITIEGFSNGSCYASKPWRNAAKSKMSRIGRLSGT